MGAIFVSYRRGDSEGQARALAQALAQHIGKTSVFMDVDGIQPGRDFRQVLNERLASCDMMLVIIGKGWLSATDAAGKRRLDDPRDFVRQEVAAALKRNIPVTPVLVQGASIPSAEELPDDLQDLTYRNSFELGHNRWESDVNEMIRRLGLKKSRMPYWLGGSAVALLLLAVAVSGVWRLNTQGNVAPLTQEASPEASTLKPAEANTQPKTTSTVIPEPKTTTTVRPEPKTTTTIPEATTTVPAPRAMGSLEHNMERVVPIDSLGFASSSAEECSQLCGNTASCEAMSFRPAVKGKVLSRGICFLKDTPGQPTARDGYVSAMKQGSR